MYTVYEDPDPERLPEFGSYYEAVHQTELEDRI